MKMLLKILLLVLFVLTVLLLCFKLIGTQNIEVRENRHISLINKSNNTIYWLLSDFGEFDKNINSSNIDSINPNLLDSIYCPDSSWDSFEIRSANKICIFVIAKDVIAKYSMDSVLKKQIYTKKILVDIDYLKKNRWTIVYK
jgi:hypothetical protein